MLEKGKIIFLGNNQENTCYPSGLCAERTAIYAAVANFPDVAVVAIAITAKSLSNVLLILVLPCGACRQAIAEYELKQKNLLLFILWVKKVKWLNLLR